MSRMKPHWEWEQAQSSEGPHGRQLPDPGPYMATGEPALGIRSILIAVGRALMRMVRRRGATRPGVTFEAGTLLHVDADGRCRVLHPGDVRAVTRTVTPDRVVVVVLGTDGQRVEAGEGDALRPVVDFARSLDGVRLDRLETPANGRHVVWSIDRHEIEMDHISP